MVWIPFNNLNEIDQLDNIYEKIDPFGNDPLIRIQAEDSSSLYTRYETIITKAFKFQTQYSKESDLVKSSDRIYEYRSYESRTDQLHLNKVHMFNEGQEIALFKKLNFNAVFYSKAIAGCGQTVKLKLFVFQKQKVNQKVFFLLFQHIQD